MSPARLRLIATLSVLCTVVVLVAGAEDPGVPPAARAALARQVVVPVAAPAASDPAPAHDAAPPAIPDGSDAAVPDASGNETTTTASDTPPAASADAPKPAARPQKPSTPAARKPKPSRAGHVFVIALTAGANDDLATNPLRAKGTLLTGFAPLDAAELPNYLALVSGQPPNAATRAECATYADFPSDATAGDDGVFHADGCIYPNTVLSLADQVTSSSESWRAYVGGMDAGAQAAQSCRHPDNGTADPTLTPAAGETYATRRNPFVYFHSLLDLGDCQAQDGPLTRLPEDLKTTKSTPNLAYVAPDTATDSATFLQTWAPQILASPAYRHDGALLVLLLARAPGATTPTGALVLSRYAKPGATIAAAYNPYSALRTIEDLLGLEPLGFAAQTEGFAHAALPGAFGPA